MRPWLLTILAVAVLACGPSGPETRTPASPPTSPTAGPTPAPTSSPTPIPAPTPATGGPSATGGEAPAAPGLGGGGGRGGGTSFARRIGGEGVEWAQCVAAAPDGTSTTLTVIGVRGDAVDQLGVIHSDAAGRELSARALDQRGASFRFPAAGACAGAPSGNLVATWAGRCAGDRCPTLDGRELRGASVVSLTSGGALAWARDLPGDEVTQVAVGPAGEVAVGSGGALHALHADGTTRWDRDAPGIVGASPLAIDSGGNVLWGRGGTIVKLAAADGAPGWERPIGAGATAVALAVTTGDDVVVVGRATAGFDWAGWRFDPTPSEPWFVATLSSAGEPRWIRAVDAPDDADATRPRALLAPGVGGDLALVTEATGCGAEAAMLGTDGAARWRRRVARAGCSGSDLVVHGLAVTPAGDALLAGSLSGDVNLGGGALPVQATDGFLAAFEGGR